MKDIRLTDLDGTEALDEDERLALSRALLLYNRLRALAAVAEAAATARGAALGVVAAAWRALERGGDWGAHHDYARAVDRARVAIGAWEAAAEAVGNAAACARVGALTAAYARHIRPAGFPPVRVPNADVRHAAYRMRSALEVEDARRRKVIAARLRG